MLSERLIKFDECDELGCFIWQNWRNIGQKLAFYWVLYKHNALIPYLKLTAWPGGAGGAVGAARERGEGPLGGRGGPRGRAPGGPTPSPDPTRRTSSLECIYGAAGLPTFTDLHPF